MPELANRRATQRTPLKVLIVNVFFDDMRRHSKNAYKIPQATAPLHLAGLFNRSLCDVAIHNEHASGPLTNRRLLAWPDVLILTGLNVAYDRMLHLTAYARTLNPAVIVIGGGHAVRALRNRSARIFDYVVTGDVESLPPLIESLFGAAWRIGTITALFDG